MTASQLSPFPVFDADRHIVEPAAVWVNYLDAQAREAARAAFWYEGGDHVLLNGELIALQRILPKGAAAVGREGHDATTCLREMDRLGIAHALLFPTLFAEGLPLVADAMAATALARAYNTWVQDYAHADPARLIPVGVVPLQQVDAAVQEVRRLGKAGIRAVLVRPGFVGDRYITTAYYDPLWQALASEGLVACVHPSLAAIQSRHTSYAPVTMAVGAWAGLGSALAETIAAPMDCNAFLMNFMSRGLLEKYPALRVGFFHAGAAWLPLVLEKTETGMWLCNQKDPVSLEPGRVFHSRENMVTFSARDGSVRRMPDEFAQTGTWGSQHPYPDVTTPREAIEELRAGNVPKDLLQQLMGGNAARVLGIQSAPGAQQNAGRSKRS
jgi:predicted TIM-barrel fold metal-dependent hydrolase